MDDEHGNLQQAQTTPEAEAQTTPPVNTKSIDQIVSEMLAGNWGRGQIRRRRLREAGVDVEAAEKAYSEVIRKK